jgi:hypothetical protein
LLNALADYGVKRGEDDRAMARKQQVTERDQHINVEGKNLPVPTEPEAKTVPNNQRDSVGVTDAAPKNMAESVPYEDSGDSEAGLLDDEV